MRELDETRRGYLERALEMLKEYEPSAEFIEPFYSGPSAILHVKLNEVEYVFKPALVIADNEQLPKEARILNDLRNVRGITHLVEKYCNKLGVRAILKEFFPGKKLGWHEQIRSPQLRKKLEDTIAEIHQVGYVHLDLHEGNIIISDDETNICFIDPIQGHTLMSTSERKRNIDKSLLKQLFYPANYI
ncbi:MAG: hypothetical protein Q8Q01_01400 [archaeon]|nr:hypothetical protein [archaeon]